MNTFTWNGVNCATYDIICSNGGTYGAPEWDVTVINIPGRNAPLTIDNGCFKPINVTFQCHVRKAFATNAPLIRNWLRSGVGFCRLTDDAHPGEYRMARPIGEVEFEPMFTDKEADINITFECHPQRYLTSGETARTLTNPATLTNPTGYESRPRIRVNGSGDFTLTINGKAISFTDNNSGITIDSEIYRAYNGSTPKDSSMTGDYPVLVPGENTISWTGSGVTSVQITPRWWTI